MEVVARGPPPHLAEPLSEIAGAGHVTGLERPAIDRKVDEPEAVRQFGLDLLREPARKSRLQHPVQHLFRCELGLLGNLVRENGTIEHGSENQPIRIRWRIG